MEFTKERIEHLTHEIDAVTANVMTFRTRMGFTVLIGPFIVMGSVVIATEGKVATPEIDLWLVCSAIAAVASYFALAWYGSRLDQHMCEKCDDWREAIVELSQGEDPALGKIKFPHRALVGYLLGFGLVLIAFLSVAYCLLRVLPSSV